MASAKRTPKVSRISRSQTLAYARKQKPNRDDGGAGSGGDGGGGDDGDGPEEVVATGSPAAPPAIAPPVIASPAATAAPAPHAGSQSAIDLPVTPPVTPPVTGAPVPAARVETPAAAPTEPLVEPPRARVETVRMPAQASIGSPPEMPAAAIVAPAGDPTAVEDPTHMPGPREIPSGHPDDLASPPGRVPPGDSRSMRRRMDGYEFALVYRIQTYVISRVGAVGTRGQWRVVEYPTPAMASHAYAKECSRFVSEGFSDYRE